MRILFLLNNGLGNQVQTIPLYNALKDHTVDVEYLMQYPTDRKLEVFPNQIVPNTNMEMVQKLSDYDYIIKPWRIYDGKGEEIQEFEDAISEMDSEFERNMKILDYLKIERSIDKTHRTKEINVPQKYITVHNGANPQPQWNAKRYPYMEQVCRKLQLEGITVVSVGSQSEHVFGTVNMTGLDQRQTAHVLERSSLHLSTDTFTFHLSALVDTPSVVIFTLTDPGKNYDKNFHDKAKIVSLDLDCRCQKGICWMERTCNGANHCNKIPYEQVYERVIKWVK